MATTRKRISLYDRLPAIYRIRDKEFLSDDSQEGELEAFVGLIEQAFGAVHSNIESLYHDLFIDTCDDWVIPYIADLLGTTHLKGDPATLRADVADTIALRRRKGTRHALELLAANLTRWTAHTVELRERLLWHQHLNHLRPDAGGTSPFPALNRVTPPWGGTLPVRDPATLSLLGTPFDPAYRTPDLRPPNDAATRPNLPNLAVFLWRLQDYRIALTLPGLLTDQAIPAPDAGDASFAVRLEFDPLARPVRLFNTNRSEPSRTPPILTSLDETPGPILAARLDTDSPAGNPEAYCAVIAYDDLTFPDDPPALTDVGIHLFVPESAFPAGSTVWTSRGDNLCAWEVGLRRPLEDKEVVIDPDIGRAVIGVGTAAERDTLLDNLLVSYTYASPGPVGAHPVDHGSAPASFNGSPTEIRRVGEWIDTPLSLQDALADLSTAGSTIVVEIADSLTHDLDISTLSGTLSEDGFDNIGLNHSLIIRGADGQRPVIRLAEPLRFRPVNVHGATEAQQQLFDAALRGLTVRFEGVYVTRAETMPAGSPLIARAAVDILELIDCTLDPVGFRNRSGGRTPVEPSLQLDADFGFTDPDERLSFAVIPDVTIDRSITGPLLAEESYRFFIQDGIIDAGAGTEDPPALAFGSLADPVNDWGGELEVSGVTFFGNVRATRMVRGSGGIWVHPLEIRRHQEGCIRNSTFPADGNRLPTHVACVFRDEAVLHFTDEAFGEPAYGQLASATDWRIRERGPSDDAMGAYNFLLNSHRWHNLEIRCREFLPAGTALQLIPVT